MDSYNTVSINRIKINKTFFQLLLILFFFLLLLFFMLLIVKSFENYISAVHNLLFLTNPFPDCLKLIGYFASAVNVVLANCCWSVTINYNIFSLIINMHRWGHINSKNNNSFSIASFCKWKIWMGMKSYVEGSVLVFV